MNYLYDEIKLFKKIFTVLDVIEQQNAAFPTTNLGNEWCWNKYLW